MLVKTKDNTEITESVNLLLENIYRKRFNIVCEALGVLEVHDLTLNTKKSEFVFKENNILYRIDKEDVLFVCEYKSFLKHSNKNAIAITIK